ncbi:DUF6160 family protein [Alkanindiges illinoisensis]|uniref:FilA n=1 Tax=Alkanindiges illinoisensis TaxID=197183 RepID=A0A4Y7XCS5_9GAMM|nr:DUF6160 family protein [Alkanindiges illinoisensis]TEU27857.1 FilA [Alkanindiges illinoisensis]
MKKVLVTLSILALSHTAFALEQLNDQDLASQTGQDGITIKVGISEVAFDQAALVDSNGMTGASNSAALVMAPNASGSSIGINFLNGAGAGVNNLVTATIDSDAGNAGAFANINLAFSELKTIKVDPFSIYLAPTLNNSRTIGSVGSVFDGAGLRAGVSKLLQVGEGAEQLNINFINPLAFNVQLGNSPQGHMVKFSGSLQSINLPKLKIFSNNSGNQTSALSLDASFKANNSTSGFSLDGFYLDVTPDGLNFGNQGTTDKFDVLLNNVVAGQSGASEASTFNGLKNGSMGNFGVVGATVSNLKMNVRGM